MMELGDLSQLCFDHACGLLRDENGVRSESLLALFAGLTGAQLFANEADAGPDGWDLPPGAPRDFDGVSTMVDELCRLIHQVIAGHLNKDPKVAASLPPDHAVFSYPELVADHASSFDDLLTRHAVEPDERPFLFAVVAAQAIITVERGLPIPLGLKIVDDGIRFCARVRPLETRRRMLS